MRARLCVDAVSVVGVGSGGWWVAGAGWRGGGGVCCSDTGTSEIYALSGQEGVGGGEMDWLTHSQFLPRRPCSLGTDE